MLYVVDLSSNNPGPYDFIKARKAGVAGCICKVTEGVGYRNPVFETQWDDSKAAGMVHGCYHYAESGINTAIQEVAWFLKNRPPLYLNDMIALDMETAGNRFSAEWAYKWLQMVESAIGYKPMIYSY